MDDAIAALAQRAVKCKAWRWLPGMLVVPDGGGAGLRPHRMVGRHAIYDNLNIWCHPDGFTTVDDGTQFAVWLDQCGVPDLSDPATLGCLLHLVREAWGENTGLAIDDDEGWWSVSTQNSDGLCFVGDTREQALVAALEDAP